MITESGFDIISIYKDVLTGERNRFPLYTWLPQKGGHDNFRRCLRYLVFQRLGYGRDQITKNITLNFFIKHKLRTPFHNLHNCSPFSVVNDVFRDLDIYPWELKISPDGIWTDQSAIQAIRWLFNEKLAWSRDEIIKRTNYKIFSEHNLSTLIHKRYDSLYSLLAHAFPEYNFKQLEFKGRE